MAAPHAAGRGWNNLPTELKVEILSYNIVASLPLTYEDFEIIPADHGAINPYPDRADSKYHLVADMAILRLVSREMSAIAYDVFYTGNTFRPGFKKYNSRRPSLTFAFPALFHSSIRWISLHVNVYMCQNNNKYWTRYCQLASGQYGLQGVQEVYVVIDAALGMGNMISGRIQKIVKSNPMTFHVGRLTVRIVYGVATESVAVKDTILSVVSTTQPDEKKELKEHTEEVVISQGPNHSCTHMTRVQWY